MIGNCEDNYKDLPVQPPAEVDKSWTISKTETAIIITCNDVEVLNYLFADSSGDECVTKLGGVEEIKFASYDTASDQFYYSGKVTMNQQPTESSKQPIRTRCLGYVTGYQPIRD